MTTTQNAGYHAVLAHAHHDRHGFTPQLHGYGSERAGATQECEAEHDWVLLIFARSPRLQAAARRAVGKLGDHHAYAAIRGDLSAAADHVRVNVARALCGMDYDSQAVGYLTMEMAMVVLAIASE